jgi:NHLM bacteriocin system ABC transporter ATP-binding protein
MTEPSSHDATASIFLLRIVACGQTHRTGECIAIRSPIVIGREPGCGVVLDDPSVSRRHARVEIAPAGIKVTDLGSGNGVWFGSNEVTEAVLNSGDRFRIGSTVFECLTRPPTDHELPEATVLAVPPHDVLVRIVQGSDRDPTGKRFVVSGHVATIGRAADCTIVLSSADISRQHARLVLEPGGIRITDPGSSSGVWINGAETKSALLRPGERFRLGSRLVLECLIASPVRQLGDASGHASPTPTVGEDPDETRFVPLQAVVTAGLDLGPTVVTPSRTSAHAGRSEISSPGRQAGPSELDFAETVVMPLPPQLAATGGQLENEGELLQLGAHQAFLLDDPTSAWLVLEGGILIFTTTVERGQAIGPRAHFLGIPPGQMCFGFDRATYGLGSGFLAVPKQGTKISKIARARLQEISDSPSGRATIAAFVDTWISGLSRAIVATLPVRRSGELPLKVDQRVDLKAHVKATSDGGVVWVDLWNGSVLFDDLTMPLFTEPRALFPLSGDAWIQAASDEFGALTLLPKSTVAALANPLVWTGLDVFHRVVCECEFINKELTKIDEYIRLEQKANRSEAAAAAAYDAIGSVMRPEAATPHEFLALGAPEPTIEAWRLVSKALGVTHVKPIALDQDLTFEERVAAVASAWGFRTRIVALRDDWWRRDHGPLLGQRTDTGDPIALIPKGARSYEAIEVKAGTRVRIDNKIAGMLSGFAYAPYRSLPRGELKVADLVRFGATGIRKDLYWVIGMAVILGVLGTATPYIVGQVFDGAIPQANRGTLLGFGLALLLSATASSAFRVTQGIAALRIQTRISSSVQAGIWDRLLDLPATFFKSYSAGDLADRAEGVDAIQGLVSGAGVAAILGSVSGLFYLVQMFTYDLRLALLAILLTGVFVTVSTGFGYLQLRYQRAALETRGRITGLVFNLLTGVTKVRTSGAEQHAFRVWAEQFASQRRLAFLVGSIQNATAVFGSTYPIICSIAIFYVVVGEQQRIALTRDSPLTTGDFIAFTSAFGLFLTAMQALGDASLSLLRVVPLYERLKPIVTARPESDHSKAAPGKLSGEIELSHVHFRYRPDGPWIIKDLSIRIQPGEFVAFVGASGAGKSTMIRLMLGLERPTSGSIYYDGKDLSLVDPRQFRQQMGVVLQNSHVMPTDIYRNIVGASSRTIEDAWDAAGRAGLAGDIRQMPMGMYTCVSEGGTTFSAGQRQRLMIARAMVNKPKIIFLDEATSALDNRTQAVVSDSMNNMDVTRIVIAHRLSTVMHADRICVLDGGTIAEVGSYQELMDRRGLFERLARRQMA